MRLLSSFFLLLLSSSFSLASQQLQTPLTNKNINLPPMDPFASSAPTLADILTITPSTSIFFSYARELPLSAMLSDPSAQITLLVPTNKAVMALPRKPQQSAPEAGAGEVVITEEEFEEKRNDNVRRWISAHIISDSPIELSGKTYDTLLEGKSITFTPISKHDGKGDEWTRVTVEDGVKILGKKEASNGIMYIIDGTINIDTN